MCCACDQSKQSRSRQPTLDPVTTLVTWQRQVTIQSACSDWLQPRRTGSLHSHSVKMKWGELRWSQTRRGEMIWTELLGAKWRRSAIGQMMSLVIPWAIMQRCLHVPTFSHFDTIPACNRQTHDDSTYHTSTASCGNNHTEWQHACSISIGRLPDHTWKHPSGRPHAKWTDQLCCDDNNTPTATLWRQAIGLGHLRAMLWSVWADYALTMTMFQSNACILQITNHAHMHNSCCQQKCHLLLADWQFWHNKRPTAAFPGTPMLTIC